MRTTIGLLAISMSILAACGPGAGAGAGGGPDQGSGAGGGGSDPGSGPGGGGAAAAPAECFERKPGCVLSSDVTRIEDPDVPEEDLTSLSRNNADFALDLGRALHSANDNVVYSPYSVSTALAMTYAGARGTTEEAIAKAMRFELPQARLHAAFNHVDLTLQKHAKGQSDREGSGFRLHTANAIWAHVDLSIEPPFLKVLGENYGAKVRLADFLRPQEAEDLINAWVSDQTEAMIPKLLDRAVNAETRIVLTNAISFDAAWNTPFDKDETKPGTFRRGDGESVSVQMMNGRQETRYGAGEGWEAVELNYASVPVSMLLLMPAEGTADTFVESLDGAALETIRASMHPRSVDVTMPKFSFRSHAPLKEALEDLGMGVAFTDAADLSGMLPGGGIMLQNVIHQAVIDVDEAGTKAAAATAVVIATSGTGAPEPAEIVLDRPFFFFINDMSTGAILFAGRVNDPAAQGT